MFQIERREGEGSVEAAKPRSGAVFIETVLT